MSCFPITDEINWYIHAIIRPFKVVAELIGFQQFWQFISDPRRGKATHPSAGSFKFAPTPFDLSERRDFEESWAGEDRKPLSIRFTDQIYDTQGEMAMLESNLAKIMTIGKKPLHRLLEAFT